MINEKKSVTAKPSPTGKKVIPDKIVTDAKGNKTVIMGSKMASNVTEEHAKKMLKEKGVFLL